MAKIKTADDLEREANDIIKKAKKEQQSLLQKARKLREDKYAEIGKRCVEYFKNNIEREQLETFIINSGLMNKEDVVSGSIEKENQTTYSGSDE